MPGIDYQTLNNPYLSHAWNRLSDTHTNLMSGTNFQTLNKPYQVSCMEQTIKCYATPTNLMPRIDY